MNNPNNILVLDGNERSSLAITRCLGQHSLNLTVGAETINSLAGSSRYCSHTVKYISPYTNPVEFISDISKIIAEYDINFLIPATDVTTYLISLNRQRWPNVTIPIASHEQIDLFSNKYALFKIAQSAGLPIPNTHYIDNHVQALNLSDTLNYPVVLKPFRSRILQNDEWLVTSVRIVNDAKNLRSIINSSREYLEHPFLIQQYIPGDGIGYFVLYNNGSLVTDFCHRRLREKPPSGGVSVYSESDKIDARLREYTQKLFKQTSWHGVAMVEFKAGADGIPYLMEINTRFWGSLQLAIDAGIEFPYLLYKISTGQSIQKITEYKKGIRLRWLLGDLDRLWLIFKSHNYSALRKIIELLIFLNFFTSSTRFEVNRIHDPKPFLHEISMYIRNIFGKQRK